MTIRELHRLAYTRMPKPRVHDILHGWAVFLGKQSLTELTMAELDELALHIRHLPPAPLRPRRASRPRSGRRPQPGVTLMISPAQIGLIDRLAGELGWTKDTLARFLKKFYGVGEPRDLATSRQASVCIQQLLGIKQERARQDRTVGIGD